MLDRLTETMNRLLGQGREQTDAVRAKRRRSRLIQELGDLYYRSKTGEHVEAEELERHVEQIIQLDTANPKTDGPEPESPTTAPQPVDAPSDAGQKVDEGD